MSFPLNRVGGLGLAVLFACKPSSELQRDASPVRGASTEQDAGDASATIGEAVVSPAEVVARWNDANSRHDSRALESLYADPVWLYKQRLSRAASVKRKADAFAKSPDYSQAVRDVVVERHETTHEWVARFTKTSTIRGKSTDYPSTISIDDAGRITVEDDISVHDDSWCFDIDDAGTVRPNDKVVAPFKISARAAASRLLHSKYARDAHAQVHDVGTLDVTVYTCPSPSSCLPGQSGPPMEDDEYRPRPDRSCFYSVRLSYFDRSIKALGGSGTSWFSAGEWVDAVTSTLWFQTSSQTDPGWHSEASPK